VHEQQRISAATPRNHFPLLESTTHALLIAGGIGITPILSMLKTLARSEASLEVHYAARSRDDFAYRNEIVILSGGRAHFYHPDAPGASRMNPEQLLSHCEPGTHVYACGPARLLQAVRSAADSLGWDPDRIHFEAFGNGSVPDDKAFTVELARSRRTLEVKRNESALDAILKTGLSVPHSCKRGECGMCATPVVAGQPAHRDLCLSEAQRRHTMCPCVSRAATGHLVLDL
jgi:vanillate O-demethylase ferredoxin subunit